MEEALKPDVVSHYFVGKDYAKVMRLKEGEMALTHKHKYDHDSVLAVGSVIVRTDQTSQTYKAPTIVKIYANVEHSIFAMSDVLWLCIHENAEGLTDPEEMDEVLIA